MVVDLHQPVIFSRLRYHHADCRFVGRATSPEPGQRWEAIYRLAAPCSSCLPKSELTWWLQKIASSHQNCSPYAVLSDPVESPIGRPRAFDPDTFRRVLIQVRGGKSYRKVAEAIADSDAVFCTRATVWRAVNGYSPYDGPEYRRVAAEVGLEITHVRARRSSDS